MLPVTIIVVQTFIYLEYKASGMTLWSNERCYSKPWQGLFMSTDSWLSICPCRLFSGSPVCTNRTNVLHVDIWWTSDMFSSSPPQWQQGLLLTLHDPEHIQKIDGPQNLNVIIQMKQSTAVHESKIKKELIFQWMPTGTRFI